MNKNFTIFIVIIFGCFSNVEAQVPISDSVPSIFESFGGLSRKVGNQIDCGNFFLQQANLMEKMFLDQLIEIDEPQEMEIGKVFFEHVGDTFTIVEGHEEQNNIEEILKKLLVGIDRKGIEYSIYIIEDESVNAFAIIGGHIFLTTGLFEVVGSYDELAFIIAHEVSHIDKEHTQRISKKLTLANQVSGTLKMEDFVNFGFSINQLLTTPFGQPDEYEADINGLKLMREAGYDPYRSLDFFTKMEKIERGDFITKIMSSHPFHSERKACISHYLENS